MAGKHRNPITLDELLAVLDAPASESDLRTYFAVGAAEGSVPAYTGGRFELLGGGGAGTAVAGRITSDDLVAVQMLSVRVPAEVALDLLEGELGRQVATHLATIPADVAIGEPAARELLRDESPAAAAWQALREPDGMGRVVAGKLLARKRPRLIPVYDRVVRCAYGRPKSPWLWLQDLFADRDGLLPARLASLRDGAGVSSSITALRVLDVVVWMRHHQAHRPRACPGLRG